MIDQQRILKGLERTASAMCHVLASWETLDEDLRDCYVEQFEWMLEEYERLTLTMPSYISPEIVAFGRMLFKHNSQLLEKMGVNVSSYLITSQILKDYNGG
jgi:hypothetical protein